MWNTEEILNTEFGILKVLKEYVCRVEGEFPEGKTECSQPVEVVSYKIGVCKVRKQIIAKKICFQSFTLARCPHTAKSAEQSLSV